MADKLIAIDTAKAAGQQLPVVVRDEIDVLVDDHDFTAADFGLDQVDNTRDADKPVSGPQLTALNTKINRNERGVANGVVPLDATGHIPDQYLSLGAASSIVPWGFCQSELTAGGYAGFDTEAKVREVLQGIHDSGAVHVRVAAFWSSIQPAKGGAYSWTGMDRFFTVLEEFPDLNPLVCITGTNAVPTGGTPTITEFGLLCGAIAARYGSNGTRQLRNYEVWNEQNQITAAAPFNTGATPFGPTTYTAILVAASNAIRLADPSAFILMGGLMSTVTYPFDPAPHTDWLPSDFIAAMHDLGADDYYDAINVHWYSGDVSFITGYEEPRTTHPVYVDLTVCRELVDSYGGGNKPFWITEMGLPSAGNGLDDHEQRTEWAIEQVELVIDLGFIDVWFWYNYKNAPGLTDVDKFGLVNDAGDKVQPEWQTFANINAITPQTPDNVVTADKLAITSGRGTAGVLNLAADGTMSIAPDAVGGGGGGGGSGVVGLVPARVAGNNYIFPHGLNTPNPDVVVWRTFQPVPGSKWQPNDRVPDPVWRVIDANNVELEIDRDLADKELAISVVARPGTIDTTGPGKPTIAMSSRGISTINLTITGGTDAGVGNAGVWWYRAPTAGGPSVKIADRSDGILPDSGLTPATSYTYTARRYDVFGNPGVLSDPVVISTTTPADVVPIGTVVQGYSAGTNKASATPTYIAGELTFAVATVSSSHDTFESSTVETIGVHGPQSGDWVRIPDSPPVTGNPPDVTSFGAQPSGSVHKFYKLAPSPAWTADPVEVTFSGGSATFANTTITITQYDNVDQLNPVNGQVTEPSGGTVSIASGAGDYTECVVGMVNSAPTGYDKTQVGSTQGANGPGYCDFVLNGRAKTVTPGVVVHGIGASGNARIMYGINIRKAT